MHSYASIGVILRTVTWCTLALLFGALQIFSWCTIALLLGALRILSWCTNALPLVHNQHYDLVHNQHFDLVHYLHYRLVHFRTSTGASSPFDLGALLHINRRICYWCTTKLQLVHNCTTTWCISALRSVHFHTFIWCTNSTLRHNSTRCIIILSSCSSCTTSVH